ncbi:hypothetical protein MBLNU457_g2672t1 [Dothideomycetes sp. NU457]
MFAIKCPHAQRLQLFRSFTSSASHQAISQKAKLEIEHKDNAPYPYGRALWYKQSNEGLYGGQRIQFGNNVSERTEIKTRRNWHPNIHRKTLYSVALNRGIKVRVSTRVLRTIDKVGGLDEYLLGDKTSRIKELGMKGWHLRCMVMAQPEIQERMNRQRAEYGLPQINYNASGEPRRSRKSTDVQMSVAGLEDEGGEFEVEADQTDEIVEEDTTGAESFDDRVLEANEIIRKDGEARA